MKPSPKFSLLWPVTNTIFLLCSELYLSFSDCNILFLKTESFFIISNNKNKASITVFPVTTIFSDSLFSFKRLSFDKFVGVK